MFRLLLALPLFLGDVVHCDTLSSAATFDSQETIVEKAIQDMLTSLNSILGANSTSSSVVQGGAGHLGQAELYKAADVAGASNLGLSGAFKNLKCYARNAAVTGPFVPKKSEELEAILKETPLSDFDVVFSKHSEEDTGAPSFLLTAGGINVLMDLEQFEWCTKHSHFQKTKKFCSHPSGSAVAHTMDKLLEMGRVPATVGRLIRIDSLVDVAQRAEREAKGPWGPERVSNYIEDNYPSNASFVPISLRVDISPVVEKLEELPVHKLQASLPAVADVSLDMHNFATSKLRGIAKEGKPIAEMVDALILSYLLDECDGFGSIQKDFAIHHAYNPNHFELMSEKGSGKTAYGFIDKEKLPALVLPVNGKSFRCHSFGNADYGNSGQLARDYLRFGCKFRKSTIANLQCLQHDGGVGQILRLKLRQGDFPFFLETGVYDGVTSRAEHVLKHVDRCIKEYGAASVFSLPQ